MSDPLSDIIMHALFSLYDAFLDAKKKRKDWHVAGEKKAHGADRFKAKDSRCVDESSLTSCNRVQHLLLFKCSPC